MMRQALFLALLAVSSAEAVQEQPAAPVASPRFAEPALALAAEEGTEPSVLQTFTEVLLHQLREPSKDGQQIICIVALVVGLVCLVNGEAMLFQLIAFGTFVLSAVLMRNEAAATWGEGAGSTLSLVTSVEAGLIGTAIALYAYNAVVLVIGALVGFLLAHASAKFLTNSLGVDGFKDENVAVAWYSIFTLGCFGLVAVKKHGKYLGFFTSFVGGALVASSALFSIHAGGVWVDCLGVLLGHSDDAAGDASWVTNTTVWGEQTVVPGLPQVSNFQLVGYGIWAVLFLAGATFQCKSKAKAREVGVDESKWVLVQ